MRNCLCSQLCGMQLEPPWRRMRSRQLDGVSECPSDSAHRSALPRGRYSPEVPAADYTGSAVALPGSSSQQQRNREHPPTSARTWGAEPSKDGQPPIRWQGSRTELYKRFRGAVTQKWQANSKTQAMRCAALRAAASDASAYLVAWPVSSSEAMRPAGARSSTAAVVLRMLRPAAWHPRRKGRIAAAVQTGSGLTVTGARSTALPSVIS